MCIGKSVILAPCNAPKGLAILRSFEIIFSGSIYKKNRRAKIKKLHRGTRHFGTNQFPEKEREAKKKSINQQFVLCAGPINRHTDRARIRAPPSVLLCSESAPAVSGDHVSRLPPVHPPHRRETPVSEVRPGFLSHPENRRLIKSQGEGRRSKRPSAARAGLDGFAFSLNFTGT
jgi:hypothetical protein